MHSAPHIHGMKKSIFWTELSKVCNTSSWQNKAIYYPVLARDYKLIILLFFNNKQEIPQVDLIKDPIEEFIDILTTFLQIDQISQKLAATEVYVKEVGHDIASSVQVIISKLHNVSNGHYKGNYAIEKIKEAEYEIMAAYRTADTLGITVDSDYNIKSGKDFKLSDAINKSITLCLSEANERHIDIKFSPDSQLINMYVWGDDKAIQTVMVQLLMNAIKYAISSTDIYINIFDEDQNIRCTVRNVGNPIQDNERQLIWEFGYRGSKAIEMHVNGSGIGLYTVKKIITAHAGQVGLTIKGDSKNISLFHFIIPKKKVLDCPKLLLK